MCPPRGRSPAGRARPARRRRPGTRPDANGSLTSSDRDTGRRCHRPGLRRRPSARFPRGRGLSWPRHPPAGMPRPEPARDAVDDACQFQRLSDAVCRLAERPSQQDGFRQCATVSSLKPLHAREGDFRALMARLAPEPGLWRSRTLAVMTSTRRWPESKCLRWKSSSSRATRGKPWCRGLSEEPRRRRPPLMALVRAAQSSIVNRF